MKVGLAARRRRTAGLGHTASPKVSRKGRTLLSNLLGHSAATPRPPRNIPVRTLTTKRRIERASRGKKIAIAVVLAVLVVFVWAGTAAALWVNSVNDTLTKGQKSATELDEINDVLVKTTSFDEPFYMMLIGSDARADDESMGAAPTRTSSYV